MKLTPHKGLFLAGLVLLFSNTSMAADDPCEGQVYEGRTCLDNAGEAEVIADTGYKHTLFDSADNKCQHCHNDLYDTWKTSMHAKSWADPIFQSKYQDFLRLQVSKIGLYNPSTDKTYMPGMIQKSGQVCIKCHAPAAFYSDDFELDLVKVGNQNESETAYDDAKELQENLAPAYDPTKPATISSMARTGEVYTLTYSIGHKHNQEGINCSYCHSMETVRLMNDMDGDEGMYTLANDLKMGPIGPVVRPAGSDLIYSPDASTPDMNAFFALIGPDKGDHENTAKDHFTDWDQSKVHDGRYVMKSVETGCETKDDHGNCTSGYYTGGPFYGPFGITGLSNSREDDLSKRELLVKDEFQDAVGELPDKFEDKHQFAAYGKALCLSCHQRSSLMLNPESNGEPGLQVGDDQFLELCSTWTAFSDGVGNNFEDTKTSPKCQHCHMEPLEGKTVLHQWDQPDVLFTKDVEPHLTAPFDPESEYGPVAEGYLNNHAFMGANVADFGLTKIKTGFEADMNAKKKGKKIVVKTELQNKTAHMFPGAHPMRRVLTRVVVTDVHGNKLSYRHAKARSKFKSITNEVAVLADNTIKPGFETVDVKYNKHADVVIQGYTPDFERWTHVSSQYMDSATVDWVSPDATVKDSEPVCTETDPDDPDVCIGSWIIKGQAQVSKITDVEGTAYNFTRIYGRETGKRAPDGRHIIRPGFDSNIAADNRLKPNEKEKYRVVYNTKDAVFPLKVQYKVYYLKKGASGVYEGLTADDGFLKERSDFPEGADGDAAWDAYQTTLKKAAIYEVFDKEVTIAGDHGHGHGRGHKDDD